MSEQKSALSCAIEGSTMTITSSQGHSMSFNMHDMSQTIINQATMHGLKQKLMDAAAISRNPDTGRSASVQDKWDAITDVYDRLIAGDWNKTREGGTTTGGLLLSALMQLYPAKTKDQLVAYLAAKTPTEKAALRKVGKVAVIIEELRLARAKDDGLDGDDILGELDD